MPNLYFISSLHVRRSLVQFPLLFLLEDLLRFVVSKTSSKLQEFPVHLKISSGSMVAWRSNRELSTCLAVHAACSLGESSSSSLSESDLNSGMEMLLIPGGVNTSDRMVAVSAPVLAVFLSVVGVLTGVRARGGGGGIKPGVSAEGSAPVRGGDSSTLELKETAPKGAAPAFLWSWQVTDSEALAAALAATDSSSCFCLFAFSSTAPCAVAADGGFFLSSCSWRARRCSSCLRAFSLLSASSRMRLNLSSDSISRRCRSSSLRRFSSSSFLRFSSAIFARASCALLIR
mmetsp:Transcript_4196/g.5588  ORF Transcript_4196/g.5588 Transcript_4196/m.5588 type:complete len:288 (+) Transcript_4196:158-1021(+)